MSCSVAPDYLLELMNDTNKEICKLCSKTLDIILVSIIHISGWVTSGWVTNRYHTTEWVTSVYIRCRINGWATSE